MDTPGHCFPASVGGVILTPSGVSSVKGLKRKKFIRNNLE